jgi:DNA-3-methyladenine glycosylase
MRTLPSSFYERDPATVARDLLGKIVTRRLDAKTLSGEIVETEAYYGQNDPASRAYHGRKKFNEVMFLDSGWTFIYMVHGNWLLNIVAHPKHEVGGVLIRALRPLRGIRTMQKNRNVKDPLELTNGPGKLTKALSITKELNAINVTRQTSELTVIESATKASEVCSSRRIGVKKDLPVDLRFFLCQSKFVSRAKPRR